MTSRPKHHFVTAAVGSGTCTWVACAVLCILLCGGCRSARSTDGALRDLGFSASAITAMKQERARLARRPGRIIFNNDGCDAAYFPNNRPPTPENLLQIRTTPLLQTDVDTLAYCSISSGFGLFTHRTSIGEQLTWNLQPTANRANMTGTLHEQGTDPLAIMLQYCHANGLECYWSMRMNDTHDRAQRPDKPYPLFPTLKKTHPEYLMGSYEQQPRHASWTAVDYALPEVRDLAFRYIEEVCHAYDIDGLELDFCRHLAYLKSVAWGGRANPAETAAITDLMRRIRIMSEQVALQRKRPIVIAARVPDSAPYAKAIGLDIETWMRDGLVDLLIGSDYFQLNPWRDWAALGARCHTPVYAGLSESRVSGEDTRFRRQSRESYRARALRAWNAGVDGLYIFNIYNAAAPFLSEIGSPEKLACLDKLYFATLRDGKPENYLAAGERYLNMPILTPNNPWELRQGIARNVTWTIGDDLAAATAAGHEPAVTCHLRLERLQMPDDLLVTLDGRPLKRIATTDEWLDFHLEPGWLTQGDNQVQVSLATTAPPADGSWDVEYRCDHRLTPPAQLPWRRGFPMCNYLEEIRDDVLLLADRDSAPGAMPHLIYPWRVDADQETVAEARLKLLSTDDPRAVCIRVAHGESVEYITFEPDRVGLQMAGLSAPFTTTDAFHTYRIHLKERDILVYADDHLLLDGRGQFHTPANDRQHWLDLLYGLEAWCARSFYFGSASGPGRGEALWEFVRFRSDTRFALLRDAVLAINYPTSAVTTNRDSR